MSQMTTGWSRFAKYFHWLVFLGTLLLASEMLRGTYLWGTYYWLDVLATYALVGTLGIGASGVGALALGGLESLFGRLKSPALQDVPRGVVFILWVACWLNILRELLWVRRILPGVSILWPFGGGLAIGLAALVKFRSPLLHWMDQTARRLRGITWSVGILCLPLTLYLFLKPLPPENPVSVAPTRPDQPHPNVIIMVLDSLTSRDLSLYGYPLPTTPHLDQWASTWTVYPNAHSTGTRTLAVLPAILTGRYPCLDDWHHYGDLVNEGQGWISLAQILQSLHYETVCICTYSQYASPTRHHLNRGFDRVIERELVAVSDFQRAGLEDDSTGLTDPTYALAKPYFPRPLVPQVWREIIADLRGEALRRGGLEDDSTGLTDPTYALAASYFQEKAEARTPAPFFVYLHTSGARQAIMDNPFLGTFLPLEEGLVSYQDRADQSRLRYDEKVRAVDEKVGHLIALLKRLDLYDNSLLVITADHGQVFTSRWRGHGTPLLAAAEHSIPLLVKFPGQTEGRRVAGLVSHMDILPTVLDVIGAAYPSDGVDGYSLQLAGQDEERVLYVRLPQDSSGADKPTFAALSGDLKLVNRKGDLSLFDLAEDPEEQRNLLGQLRIDRLQSALEQFARRMEFLGAGGPITQAPGLAIKKVVRP